MWPLSRYLLAIVDVKKGVGGIFFGEEQCLYIGIILVLCRKQTPLTKHHSTMPRPPTLRLGEGATCSVLLKFLRPSREVSEKFPNAVPTQRLDDLVAVRFAVVTRGRSSYPAIFFTSPTLPGIQLQAARKKVKVLQEGHPGSYWERAEAEARIGMVHRILTAPKHAKKYQRRRWECTAAAPYQQYKCRGECNKKVRTYCACSPGVWLCFNCFPQHIRSAESED